MKSLIQLILFSSTILTYTLSAPDKKGAYATPEDAAKDPDFSIQGEYEGSYTKGNGTKSKVGIQVVALGNGIFNAVGFEGGLPGNGWDLSERAQSEAKKADDGSVTFKKEEGGSSAVLKEEKLTIYSAEGKALGTLNRINRESSTMGLEAPKGAAKLFDGSSLDHWKPGARKTDDGLLMEGVNSARNDFKNFTLHIEFRLPYMPKARGQGRGNSGMYLLGTEIQMLDS
ncbi:MAG: family 16 glycoside hydrolase, partial [Verrucomicrobiota bacterium]|nr:family 16 glycoside hydrolase [Verrucomicrobiota bacterium]